MSYLNAQAEIIALLKAIPNTDTYEGQATDESIGKLIEGTDQIKPFYAVTFGGRIKPGGRVNGINGAREDTHTVTFILHAIANTQGNANRVLESAWNRLVGFMPTNCGEIDAALFGGTGEISSATSPSRYSAVQAFRFYVNSDLAA